MLLNLASAGESPTARRLLLVRCVGLVALLLAEIIGLTLRYDSVTLLGNHHWWAELLGQAYLVPQVGIAVATALLVFGGARLRDELHQLAGHLDQPRSWMPYFLGHLLAFVSFAQLTGLIMEGDLGSSRAAGIWFLIWVVLGLAVLALLVASALPASVCKLLVRRASGPLLASVVIGGLAWGAGHLTDTLWYPLGRSTLALVHGLLRLGFSEVVCDPAASVVGTGSFAVQIAPSCSGYEGIGLTWVFLAVYLWYYRHALRFPRALLLLPVGTVVIWLANVGRIAALVAIGTWGSPAVALGGFHSQAGWLAFNAVALGLVALTHQSRFFVRADPSATIPSRTNHTAAYVLPLLAIVLVTMLTTALCSGFDYLYPLRVLAVIGAVWFFRRQYAERCWGWSWQAVAIGVVVFVVWMALEPVRSGTGEMGLPTSLASLPTSWAVAWLVFRVVGSVITVPLAEELAFRGYLSRRLMALDFQEVPLGSFSWFSFLVSSLVFGALHGRWFAGILAGMLYAVALYRRKDLGEAVLAHATTNALIAAYVLTTGTWSLWC